MQVEHVPSVLLKMDIGKLPEKTGLFLAMRELLVL